jgi:hypothetical protein
LSIKAIEGAEEYALYLIEGSFIVSHHHASTQIVDRKIKNRATITSAD